MFSPRLIFSLLWLSQIFLHVIFPDAFYPFEFSTWAAIFFCFVFFNFGALISGHLGVDRRGSGKTTFSTRNEYIGRFFYSFVVLYAVASGLAGLELYRALQELGADILNLPRVREIVIADFNGSRSLYNLFRVFYLGVGFSIFFVAFSRYLSRGQLALVLVIGLLSALVTTGRLYLLLYFLAVTALLYRAKLISPKGVLFAGFIFASLFFLVALLLGKGDGGGGLSVLESVLWNSQVYLMSSVSCFNDYLVTGHQQIDGGALLPNVVRELLLNIGLNIPPKPSLNPFAEVPVACNTYTFMFPLFHDGSFFGVALGSFLIGAAHQYLYLKSAHVSKPVWGYLYAISIYALFMSVFEDAYFSSPGFWVSLWMPPITYYVFQTVRLRIA